jgi:feruloyl esterase
MAGQISHRDADAAPPQDLIVQEPWLSRPLPGTARLARWAAELRSARSQVTASLRRHLRPGRRRARLAALLAAVTVAALIAAAQLTARPPAQPARAWAPTGNTISTEARLSQQVATADCAALSGRHLAGLTVDLAQADTSGSFTGPPGQHGAILAGLPAFCDVRLTQDNPPAAGRVQVEVWLPLVAWNGRFHAVGGGGHSRGISYSALAQALQSGYATASTDDRRPVNADHRGTPQMTVAGNAVTTAFYGIGPS